MILKIICEEYGFNIEPLIIKESKRLGLTAKELVVLLMLFSAPVKKRTLTISGISKKVDCNQNEVAEIIETLLEKKFVTLVLETHNKKEREVYILDGTYEKLTNLLLEDEKEKKNLQTINKVAATISLLEEKLGRMLRSNELERVRTWYDNYNFNHDKIVETINNAHKNISVMYIEKVLNLDLDQPEKLDKKTEQVLDNIFKKM